MKVKKIKKGSAVGIITPAAAIDKNSSRFKLLEERLNNLGLKVKYGKAVGKRYGYLGGTDEDRIEDLEAMFLDSEVSVIIAMLGGYGSSRIVDKVNYEIIKNNPKLLIGFSDITVFINAIYQKTNLPTIHGPVGIYLGKVEFDSISQADFEALLFTSQQGRILKNPKDNAKTLVSGKAKGKLVGGNLSLIATLIGTPYEVDFTDKIIFIEDVDEAPYAIDRYFSSLRLSGSLKKAKGFVFGYFSNIKQTENSFTIDEIIEEYFIDLNVPIITNFSSGHDLPFISLPIGLEVELDSDRKTIKILEELYEAD